MGIKIPAVFDPTKRLAKKALAWQGRLPGYRQRQKFSKNVRTPRAPYVDNKSVRWASKSDKAGAKAEINAAKARLATSTALAFRAGVYSRNPLNPVGLGLRAAANLAEGVAKIKAIRAGRDRAKEIILRRAGEIRKTAVSALESGRANLEGAKASKAERKIKYYESKLVLGVPEMVNRIRNLRKIKIDVANDFFKDYLKNKIKKVNVALKKKTLTKAERSKLQRYKTLLNSLLQNPDSLKLAIESFVQEAEKLNQELLTTRSIKRQDKITEDVLDLYEKYENIRKLLSKPVKLLLPTNGVSYMDVLASDLGLFPIYRL